MRSNPLPILILIIAVLLMAYSTVDYFLADGAFNYWMFFIGIIVLFFGIAIISRNYNNRKE